MSSHLKYAQKRLWKDWKEIRSLSPEEGIFAEPLEEDIFEWHVNIVPRNGRYQGIILHCIMNFPETYPTEPPKVKLSTSIPHSNIIEHNGEKNYLCLDILKNFFWMEGGEQRENTRDSFSGWSSAYSVRTIVTQIQSFLFEDYVENYDGSLKDTLYQLAPEYGGGNRSLEDATNSYEQAFVDAKNLRCHKCGHTHTSPVPKITIPIPPRINGRLRVPLYKMDYIPDSSFEDESCISDEVLDERHQEQYSLNPGFVTIIQKWYREICKTIDKNSDYTVEYYINHYFNNLLGKNYNLLNINNRDYIEDCDCPTCNETRKMKKTLMPFIENKTLDFSEFQVIISKLLEVQPNIPMHLQSYNENIIWKLIQKSGYSENLKADLEINVGIYNLEVSNNRLDTEERNLSVFRYPILDNIPTVLVQTILTYLKIPDKYQVGKVNKYLNNIAFSPYFMERLDTFCYYTREHFEEEVLGYGIDIIYHKGGIDIKEINSPLDLLSFRAFHECNITNGLRNEKISYLLPLVINDKHLQRSKDLIIITINNICSHYNMAEGEILSSYLTNELRNHHYNSTKIIKKKMEKYHTTKSSGEFLTIQKNYLRFQPKFALRILGKLMNNCVVKLMKGDTHVSKKALEGYCYFHRLLLQFTIWYPEILEIINTKIYKFINFTRERLKSKVPNLGELLVYLSISDRYTWNDLKTAYLEEQGIRSVLWILRSYPKWAFPEDELDLFNYDRLYDSFQATKIGKKLTAFNVYFINHIAKKHGNNLNTIKIYDKYYGKPKRGTLKHFQQHIQNIETGLLDWKSYYRFINSHFPTTNQIANTLRMNIVLSGERKYHDLKRLQITSEEFKNPIMYGSKGWKNSRKVTNKISNNKCILNSNWRVSSRGVKKNKDNNKDNNSNNKDSKESCRFYLDNKKLKNNWR